MNIIKTYKQSDFYIRFNKGYRTGTWGEIRLNYGDVFEIEVRKVGLYYYLGTYNFNQNDEQVSFKGYDLNTKFKTLSDLYNYYENIKLVDEIKVHSFNNSPDAIGFDTLSMISEREEQIKELIDDIEKLKSENKNLHNLVREFEDDEKETKKILEELKNRETTPLGKIIIPDEKLTLILGAFDNNFPMLLFGPSGTGKSSLVRAIAEHKKMELRGVSFNGDTNVEHLLGHFVLENGETVFKDGPLTDAVRNGKIFLADEINASNPEIQFILNSLLENRDGKFGELVVQGNHGEIIQPHLNFRFFGTYNPGYLGTKKFSNSLLSRFISVEIPPLEEEEEALLLLSKFPNASIGEIKQIIKLKNDINSSGDIEYDISTRDLEQILKLNSIGVNLKDAITTCIVNSCQYEDEKKIALNFIDELGI